MGFMRLSQHTREAFPSLDTSAHFRWSAAGWEDGHTSFSTMTESAHATVQSSLGDGERLSFSSAKWKVT